MARVILTDSLSKRLAGGAKEINTEASSVRALIRELDMRYPGLGSQIEDGTLSVAIDGDIFQDAYLEELRPDSEVAFLPKIGGG